MSPHSTETSMTRRALLAGSIAATMMAPKVVFAASPSHDRPVRDADVRQTVSAGRTLAMYLALPGRGRGRHPAVLIVHDADGLNEATRILARRVARSGYVACAPDLLSRAGGVPSDPAAARIMVQALDPAEAQLDAAATIGWLARNPPGERVLTGKVVAIGTGWGAALVERLAESGSTAIAAAVALGAPKPISDPNPPCPLLRLSEAQPDDRDWERVTAFLEAHVR